MVHTQVDSWEREKNRVRWETRSVKSVRGLAGGDLEMEKDDQVVGNSELAREIADDISRRHAEWDTASWPAQGDRGAFQRVTKGKMNIYAVKDSNNLGRPAKGDLCDAVPEKVSLPVGKRAKVPLSRHSEDCRMYLEHGEDLMVKREADVDWDEVMRIRPYHAPGFRDKRSMLVLGRRMAEAGMILWSTVCRWWISRMERSTL